MLKVNVGKMELDALHNVFPYTLEIDKIESYGNMIVCNNTVNVLRGWIYNSLKDMDTSYDVEKVAEELSKKPYKIENILYVNNINILHDKISTMRLSEEAILKWSRCNKISDKDTESFVDIMNFIEADKIIFEKTDQFRKCCPMKIDYIVFEVKEGTEENYIISRRATKFMELYAAGAESFFNFYLAKL